MEVSSDEFKASLHKVQPVLKDHYKLVVLGGSQVGKTSIIERFLHDKVPHSYSATVEEVHRCEFQFNGVPIILEIVDTSGSYQFPAMKRLSMTQGDAYLLVYSIDNAQSFEEIRKLHEELVELRSTAVLPIVVVGNKVDLENIRQVRREVAETVVCIDWEYAFVETSAHENVNVLQIFQLLADQFQAKHSDGIGNKRSINKRRMSLPAFASAARTREKIIVKRNSCNLS